MITRQYNRDNPANYIDFQDVPVNERSLRDKRQRASGLVGFDSATLECTDERVDFAEYVIGLVPSLSASKVGGIPLPWSTPAGWSADIIAGIDLIHFVKKSSASCDIKRNVSPSLPRRISTRVKTS